ncbi:hypothetical protein ACS0TY_020322 [Phlomoides rotata]
MRDDGKFFRPTRDVTQVLNIHAYEARQREYALQGHRHFYFMTLNGSEVCYYFTKWKYFDGLETDYRGGDFSMLI